MSRGPYISHKTELGSLGRERERERERESQFPSASAENRVPFLIFGPASAITRTHDGLPPTIFSPYQTTGCCVMVVLSLAGSGSQSIFKKLPEPAPPCRRITAP